MAFSTLSSSVDEKSDAGRSDFRAMKSAQPKTCGFQDHLNDGSIYLREIAFWLPLPVAG